MREKKKHEKKKRPGRAPLLLSRRGWKKGESNISFEKKGRKKKRVRGERVFSYYTFRKKKKKGKKAISSSTRRKEASIREGGGKIPCSL